ncbi:MAG: hypothetical protein AAF489_17105 [Bacteroidota bacterium]
MGENFNELIRKLEKEIKYTQGDIEFWEKDVGEKQGIAFSSADKEDLAFARRKLSEGRRKLSDIKKQLSDLKK